MIGVHLDAETHAQHLGFPRGEGIQNFLGGFAQAAVDRGVHRSKGILVLDEIAQVGIVVVSDGSFHGDGLLGDLQDLADLVLGHFHLQRQGGWIGLQSSFLQDLTRNAVHLVDGFDHVHRNTDGACLVRDGAGDGLANPPGGVGGKLVTTAVLEFVHGLHQTDVALLNQIQKLQAAIGVLLGNGNHQSQIRLGHLAFGAARLGLARGHLAIDLLEIAQRNGYAPLQVDQALLLLDDGGRETSQRFRVGFARGNFALDPLHVFLVSGESFDEIGAWHSRFFDANLHDRSLVAANLIHQFSHAVAQRFDLFRGEANPH